MKPLHILLWGTFWLLGLTVAALTATFFVAKAILAPLPGEWSVPLRAGPVQVQAGVPSLVRLATARWAAPLLHGRSLRTGAGRLHITWQASTQTLGLRCAPCKLRAPALGDDALRVGELRLTVRRHGEVLEGEVASGALRATWRGELARGGLRLALQLPMSPIADGYALFGELVPELARAHIEGRFALTAQLSLPGGSLSVVPQAEGFAVSGLGTQMLAAARSGCTAGKRASRLTPDSWLARAVVAAEDQRFYQHAGYDLAELGAALALNQREGRAERGASTLSQQLAKLVVTGGERSPARKLRELLYAVEMEQTLGKARILSLYMAHAPWGTGVCGAEAAARRYFGVRAHELTPAQAAWLAAMLHNPSVEAARWEATGEINLARTQRIVLAMRDMPRKQRIQLAHNLTQLPWAQRQEAAP